MSFVSGLIIGFMLCFVASRYADMVVKDAADDCGGVCEKCTAHCVGYHCYVLRNRPPEGEVSGHTGN